MAFTPHIPEKLILVQLTLREAHLIKVLRLIDFGDIKVFKANKQTLRVEANKSIILNEVEGYELEHGIDKKPEKN